MRSFLTKCLLFSSTRNGISQNMRLTFSHFSSMCIDMHGNYFHPLLINTWRVRVLHFHWLINYLFKLYKTVPISEAIFKLMQFYTQCILHNINESCILCVYTMKQLCKPGFKNYILNLRLFQVCAYVCQLLDQIVCYILSIMWAKTIWPWILEWWKCLYNCHTYTDSAASSVLWHIFNII